MAGPARILLVDDDADMREATALLLEAAGHPVTEAANGRSALKALASAPFGLVVLDLMMPVMDGPAFLAAKAKSDQALTPVVVFSASPTAGLEGFAGVVAAVSKLDGIDGLLAAVRGAGGAAPLSFAAAGGFHG